MQESVLRVGVITSVKGRSIEVIVDKSKNVPHLLYNGELIRNVSVGSYIKINKGFERIIGIIESEFITEDKSLDSKINYKLEKQKIKRILEVKLVGFLEYKVFQQGIKELPLIDNKCYILTKEEYDRVHSFTKADEDKIEIGVLSSETSKKIEIGVNSLFASHIGIFGNTGSGKSYTLASLYHSLFKQYGEKSGFKKNARFLLIDFNGEYLKNDFGENVICDIHLKEVFDLAKDKVQIEKSSIENIEILSIILDATEKTQKPFLNGVLNFSKFNESDFQVKEFLKEDIIDNLIKKEDKEFGTKAFINIFNDLYECIDNKECVMETIKLIHLKLGHNSTSNGYYIKDKRAYDELTINTEFIEPINRLIDSFKINSDNLLKNTLLKLVLKYHFDIINGYSNVEHISPLIRRAKTTLIKMDEIVRVVNEVKFDKNFKIISFKNINDNSLKKILALVICKEHYDKQKINEAEGSYLNIIIDEAHNILSHNSMRESETWKDYRLETFEEIIKEGRKFGTFLTIASQRPYDISPTIVSQLHNYFLHRLINNKDIEAIERTVSYLDKVSFESMPILPTGTCILAGLSAKIPVVVKINILEKEYEPNSHTIELTNYWGDEKDSNECTLEESDVQTKNEEDAIPDDYFDDDLPF